MDDIQYSLIGHLDELRSRILKSIIVFILCTVIVYHVSDTILFFLSRTPGTLVFIDPAEAFLAYLKVALWGGFFTALPFILYEAWAFVVSGLNRHERRFLLVFLPLSTVLFFSGAVFALFVIIPMGVRLLLSFGSEFMQPMLTVSRYISFVATLTLAFGCVFQLPIVLLFLTSIGIVSPATLAKNRKFALLIIFIVAATLTPPDIISQVAMALPLIVLYEIGILTSRLCRKRPKKRTADE